MLDYNPYSITKLLNDSKYFRRQLSNLRTLAKRSNGRHCHAFVQVRNQVESLVKNDITILTELQLKSELLDIITIPDPAPKSSNAKALDNAINIAKKRMTLYGFDEGLLMPYIDLETDRKAMEIKTKHLLKEGFSSIGIRHRENRVGSSLVVEGIAENASAWFHLSGVKKRHRINRAIPSLHIVPVHSFDSMTRYKGTGYVPKPRSDVFPEPDPRKIDQDEMKLKAAVQSVTEKIEFFEPKSLGYLTTSQYESMFGEDLQCTCPLCRGKKIADFKNYAINKGKFDSGKFTDYSIVHEAISSHNELDEAQKSIKKSSYLDYLQNKTIIRQHFNKITELTEGTFRRTSSFNP